MTIKKKLYVMFGVIILVLLFSSVLTFRSFQNTQKIMAESIALQETTNIASRLTFHVEALQGALEVSLYANDPDLRKKLLRKTMDLDQKDKKLVEKLLGSMIGQAVSDFTNLTHHFTMLTHPDHPLIRDPRNPNFTVGQYGNP